MSTHWWQRHLRVVQTNLQVADTPKLDAEEMAGTLAEAGCDVLVFNAAGIYAWYPTEVPFHNRNPFMGERDVLGEAVAACHRRGIRLVARTSFGHADERICHAHPDWFVRLPDGRPLLIGEPRPGPWGLLYQTCPNSPYQGEAVALPAYREILEHYDVDGFFITFIGFGTEHCVCPWCRRRYRQDWGEALPERLEGLPTSARLHLRRWRERCVADAFRRAVALIRATRPELLVTGEFGGGPHTPRELASLCDVLSPNCTDRVGADQPPTWASSIQTRYAVRLSGGQRPWTIVAPAPGLLWRHTCLPPAELQVWLAQILASGGDVWYALTGIPATQEDQRVMAVLADLNRFAAANEAYLSEAEPVTPVAVLGSQRSYEYLAAGGEAARYWAEWYGVCQALVAHHVLFTPVTDEELTAAGLSRFRVLVLPAAVCLGDEQLEAIRAFVEQGGGVVATAGAGTRSEAGEERPDGGLLPFLGLQPTGLVLEAPPASYMRWEDRQHPLAQGLEATALLVHEGRVVHGEPAGGARPILVYVPPFAPPHGVGAPPERATLPTPATPIPLALAASRGRGRVVLFTGEPGWLARTYGLADHLTLLANAVRWVSPEPAPLVARAPSGVLVSLFRQPERLVVHLVNGVGERPLRDVARLSGVELQVALPAGTACREVVFRGSGQCLAFTEREGWVRFAVPELEVWDIVVVELGPAG